VLLLDDEKRFRGAAERNLRIVSNLPIRVIRVDSVDSVVPHILQADAVVDAIFGTGLTREVSGLHSEVIQIVNESGIPVVSVDIPSGINGDTGEVMGAAVMADWTVAFGLPKLGNLLYPGYGHCGELHVSHISFPPFLHASDSLQVEVNGPARLPERDNDSHKGSYGKALFISGSSGYLGAPYFSALSFLKAGGGLSYLAAPKSISPFLANKGSEIVFIPQMQTASGSIASSNKNSLLELSEGVDIVVMGPGVSLDPETQDLVRELTPAITKPLLIDGDGITALAADPARITKRSATTILTPHAGEMSRLTGMDTAAINRNRIDVAQRAAADLDSIIVLKGAHSLIAHPDGKVFVNTSGNPGMATAGSGDVLSGTIAAMFGLSLPPEEAVRTGVFMHGFSGDVAAADKGEDGMTAQDILDYLPETLKIYREAFDDISENLYETVFVV